MLKKMVKYLYTRVSPKILVKYPFKKYIHHSPIPSSVKNFTVKDTDIKLVSDSSPIVRRVFWLGVAGYEENELSLFIKLCAESRVIIEIGGNVGYFTVFGAQAKPNLDYRVYEPLPYNFDRLVENLKLNRLTGVKAVNAAVVGDSSVGSIKFFVPKFETYGAATGGFIEGAESIDREVGKELSVRAIGAPEVCEAADLIKIDVEGAEFEILSSAEKEIIASKPIILVEMRRGTSNLRGWIKNMIDLEGYGVFVLSEFDNNIHRLSSDQIPSIILQDVYGTRDVIMCPQEKHELIRSFCV